jgi:hypothetical protein
MQEGSKIDSSWMENQLYISSIIYFAIYNMHVTFILKAKFRYILDWLGWFHHDVDG